MPGILEAKDKRFNSLSGHKNVKIACLPVTGECFTKRMVTTVLLNPKKNSD